MGYLYIALTILLTVYGQLILKWRIMLKDDMPSGFMKTVFFLLKLFLDPWILSGFFAAFLASLAWMATMTKFELSLAYPFMSLAFVLVLIFSGLILNELITWQKVVGLIFIIVGIVITTR